MTARAARRRWPRARAERPASGAAGRTGGTAAHLNSGSGPHNGEESAPVCLIRPLTFPQLCGVFCVHRGREVHRFSIGEVGMRSFARSWVLVLIAALLVCLVPAAVAGAAETPEIEKFFAANCKFSAKDCGHIV